MNRLVKSMPEPVPCILMSAFRRSDYNLVADIFQMDNVAVSVLQGQLARRNTMF